MTEVEDRWHRPTRTAIPRDDWDRFPWNRWTFQNIRQMTATAEVSRGNGPTWELSNIEKEFDDLNFARFDGASSTVENWLLDDYTDGFLVIKNGSIVYERYLNHMQSHTLHLSQSMAKSVTSCVAGIMIDRGQLSPDELITTYLPELDSTAYHGATLRHVLDMSSGVNYIEDYESPDSHIAEMDIASGWKLPKADLNSPNSMWEHILSLDEIARTHGQCFNYRSVETDVIAHCMERVSGKRLVDLVSEELWQPLGCEQSANFTVDRCGYAFASGGFNATLRDYGRFGLLLCNNGQRAEEQIVPADWIADTLREDSLALDESKNTLFPNGGYRNQFWLRNRGKKIMMARGIYGQLIYVDQTQKLVAVALASWPESLSIDRSQNTLNAIDAIANTLA